MEQNERVTLRELVEQRFEAMDRALGIAMDSMSHRLDAANETKEALKDLSARMRTRDECAVVHQKLDEDVRSLRESRAMLEGKASQLSVNVTLAIAIVGVVISIIGLILK